MNEITKQVFDKIDELSGKYLNVLIEACNIESKTEDKEGVDKVGAYFASIAEEMGYVIKKREFEKAGNVYSFTYNPNGSKKPISVSGHMDTVHTKGFFGYPTTRIEGDYIYGPGVNDCKGNIATELLMMEALKECGFTDRPVKLILQCDEEVNSYLSDYKSLDFMVEEAKGSAAFLNAENLDPDRKLVVARKGMSVNKLIIHGKKFHAGNVNHGVSAIKEAAHKIIAFEEGNDEEAITFNCGIINGGSVINIVPDRCEINVEYRFKNMEQKEIADKKFKEIVEKSFVEGTHTEVVPISKRLPMEPDEKNMKLVETINAICKDNGIEPFGYKETPGGADGAYPSLAGIPTVDGIGLEGEGAHTIGERARISSIAEMAKAVAAVIINFPE